MDESFTIGFNMHFDFNEHLKLQLNGESETFFFIIFKLKTYFK